ncbi:hypothetical protein QWZ14_11510 [Paeniroseomonas aquatica]|uniref:Uncharacterized protein n=1 Tax=Paeniroseomonas aquatica TaxID=373043 RepID=A0ABT8A5C7_9PROT|nr:hypothetical protein [Paeniroseomonas aquatica]MDN3564987.1 hypothetical protein [Paeniroseomonas aquatica]
MSKDDVELVRGSGNLLRYLKQPNATLEQLRLILAARIIKSLTVNSCGTCQPAYE